VRRLGHRREAGVGRGNFRRWCLVLGCGILLSLVAVAEGAVAYARFAAVLVVRIGVEEEEEQRPLKERTRGGKVEDGLDLIAGMKGA
jgi:hypothetical protein